MSEQEILAKALEKAVRNGWLKITKEELEVSMNYWNIPEMIVTQEYYRYIFNHDFAKAFFLGDESLTCHDCPNYVQGWQYQLQQMVISKDPIKYLEQFI